MSKFDSQGFAIDHDGECLEDNAWGGGPPIAITAAVFEEIFSGSGKDSALKSSHLEAEVTAEVPGGPSCAIPSSSGGVPLENITIEDYISSDEEPLSPKSAAELCANNTSTTIHAMMKTTKHERDALLHTKGKLAIVLDFFKLKGFSEETVFGEMGFKGPGFSNPARDEYGLPSLKGMAKFHVPKPFDETPHSENSSVKANIEVQKPDPFKDKMKEKLEDSPPTSQKSAEDQLPKSPPKPLWSSVVKKQPPIENLVFDYHPLKEGDSVVTPPVEVLKKGMEKFQLCLVGTFSKGTLPLSKLIENARKIWESKGLCNVSQKDSHTFLLKFRSEMEMNAVLARGTWYFERKPLLLRAWGTDFGSEKISSIPLWVRFRNLPDYYWTREGLSCVASSVGPPICADKVTSQLNPVQFAKTCVRYKLGDPLPEKIKVAVMDVNSKELSKTDFAEVDVSYPQRPMNETCSVEAVEEIPATAEKNQDPPVFEKPPVEVKDDGGNCSNAAEGWTTVGRKPIPSKPCPNPISSADLVELPIYKALAKSMSKRLNNKISYYKDFIASRKLGLIALLETHVKEENAAFISKQVAPKFTWLFNYEHHSNGRIWLGWDPGFWSISDVHVHSQHISCKVSSISLNDAFFASFIYASNDYIERRLLWNDLLNHNANLVVVSSMPWTGGLSIDIREFRDFTDSADVFDLNYSGQFFTWWDCNHSNATQRKLDRVLVNASWINFFSMSTAHFPSRGLSDHCPAITYLGISAPKVFKPFQIFQHVIQHSDFLSTVEEAWNIVTHGEPWYVLSTKIKRVKAGLKRLHNSCGNLHEAVIQARHALTSFQEGMSFSAPPDVFKTKESLCLDLQRALSAEEIFLKQKSRVQWLELGDGNNSFFHRACKSRWNVNKILMLEDRLGNTLTSHEDIASTAVDYFKELLGTSNCYEPFDWNITLPQLSSSQQSFLCTSFSSNDIFSAFKSMGKKKSPGPDGLTPEFFLAAWGIIGDDVIRGIKYFFDTLELPRIINSAAISLVQKCDNPSRMKHFRPISCCNTLYKCIAKLLAGRIQKIIASLVSINQSAFVPKRLIGDNIMLVQALCKDYHRQDGVPRCAFKLDIHKAFDSLNWDFLFAAMENMRFPEFFIRWIKKCISRCMLSVKINGVLEGYFQCKSGLRQGDPLSPYLFVLSMEILTIYLNTTLQNCDSFVHHWSTKQLKLSHVIFADDIFVFCKGEQASIMTLLDTVSLFCDCSGLKLNKEKCRAFFCNVPDDLVLSTMNDYGFAQGTLPITYLGLPLITSRLTTSLCDPLIHRLCKRIEGWVVRTLRYSGRLQLIKSVLQAIQGYCSIYLFLPKGVIKHIQSILGKFLWGGSLEGRCHYNVAWADCCFKKEEGGLGVRDLFDWNKSAIFLQIWRLSHPNPSSIWILWVHSCLLKHKAFWTAKIPYKCPWNLRKIFNARYEALQFISVSFNENSGFKLWHDPWLINEPLIQKFGEGFISVMESSSSATVGSIISNGQWSVATSNDLRAVHFRSLLFARQIGAIDIMFCNGVHPVNLNVIWDSIRRRGTPEGWLPLIWNRFHIPACSFISWLACRERLLTKDRMLLFHMNTDPKCVLCLSCDEDTEHLFSQCPYSYLILRACPFSPVLNWRRWMQGDFFGEPKSSFQKNFVFLYTTAAIYLIWRERTSRVHGKGNVPVAQLINLVKRMVREKLCTCNDFCRELSRDPSISHILY
ncbi:uncharacterized protein LOC135150335 [Daucus carota subsp. sativus]|uniref:uncharacterized protein LOC135150335 n=1 Tax=Daucus carota subsp. sativus TaxID=79200 RepID=UPI0030828346